MPDLSRLFFYPFAIPMLVALLFTSCQQQRTNIASGVQINVDLEIDFQVKKGDKPYKQLVIELDEGDTVFDALLVALDDGSVVFESRGTGETAFVTSIDGVQNENAGGSNWVYYVNGELGDCGSGAYELSEGDKVMWKFKPNGLK